MKNPFTSTEVDTLIEALDTWEQPSLKGELAGMMVKSFMPEGVHDMVEDMLEQKRKERETENRRRKEVASLLKAKLILLSQGKSIDELVNTPSDKE